MDDSCRSLSLDEGWRIVCTSRATGDFALGSPGVAGRRRIASGGRPCAWLRQVHGPAVVTITDERSMDEVVGSPADALVTARSNVALCVVTADCAPIAIVGGPVGAAIHAGWQGLRAGIIEAAVERMRGLAPAGTALKAYLGPCIHPTNYAFSPTDLETVVDRYGPTVRSTTAKGEPALDMVAAVASACAGLGLELDVSLCRDTADPPYFSHRIRRDTGRQAMFVWRDEPVFQS